MKLLEDSSKRTITRPASRIHLQFREDAIAVMTFDHPSSSANVFDEVTLCELDRCLDQIWERDCHGLVIRSAKPAIFIAGADIKSVLSNPDPNEKARLITLGQSVFSRVATLPMPTVAAIHGACVGGGFELALACDFRIATPDRCTKIGLPETKLGIVPAWGGSTRLPKLIGLPAALDIILGGKTVVAGHAKKLGMINAVVAREHLDTMAERLINVRRAKRPSHWRTNNRFSASIIKWIVWRKVKTKTRDCYPAIDAALRLVVENLRLTETKALANERATILELADTPETKRLIDIFFMQERAKKRHVSDSDLAPIDRTAVIGAGVMGAGMAQWFSARGCPTIITDIHPDRVALGMAHIEKTYASARKRRILTPIEMRQGLDRISPVATTVPLSNVDLVVEAAVEIMDIKKDIFRDLELRVGPHTILASNTSALSISEIAAATTCPDRVAGLHFFNPVHRMPLVEIVRGDETSLETVQRCLAFTQRLGKMPVVVRDRPGFVVNRLLLPYLNAAVDLFEHGVSVKAIDDAMLDFGMPMGPLRLLDEVGVDIAAHVAQTLQEGFGERMEVPVLLSLMIERGWLGKKSGAGFYLHPDGAKLNPGMGTLNYASPSTVSNELLQRRMMAPLIDEAARCLDEGVVDDPGDLDFAMIMGTGFAPFRGGPLHYADSLGVHHVVEESKRAGNEPATLLMEMAANNRTFYKD